MDARYIVDFDPRMKKWAIYDKLKDRVFAHYDEKVHAEQRCVRMNQEEEARAKSVWRNFNKL
jgi:hypothetical protein